MSAFPCRINVVDFSVEYLPSEDVLTDEWNAFSVCVQRGGLRDTRQLSRWALTSSATSSKKAESRVAGHNKSIHSRSGSGLECCTNEGGIVTMEGLLSRVSWARCNQASFVVDFKSTSEPLPAAVEYVPDPAASDAKLSLFQVHPKTTHPIQVSVIARRGGEPASSVATSKPGKALLRALNLNERHDDPSVDFTSPTWSVDYRVCEFVCPVTIDPSEVFNSPSGQLEYRFALRDQDTTRGNRTSHLPGTPRFVVFSVVAERGIVRPERFLRNYHDTCVLVDRFLLDLAGARGKRSGKVAYGLGVIADTSAGDAKQLQLQSRCFVEKRLTTPSSSTDALGSGVGGEDDGEETLIDFSANGVMPEVVVVSSDCSLVRSFHMDGHLNPVALSRFKTDPMTGLCKTSLKCAFTAVIATRTPSESLPVEVLNSSPQRIDLAKEVLNVENYPEEGRFFKITFCYGEVLYFRLRKRCFQGASHYGMPLVPFSKVPHKQSAASVMEEHCRRLTRFYQHHAVNKDAAAIESLVQRYAASGNLPYMWASLETKYGPDPAAPKSTESTAQAEEVVPPGTASGFVQDSINACDGNSADDVEVSDSNT